MAINRRADGRRATDRLDRQNPTLRPQRLPADSRVSALSTGSYDRFNLTDPTGDAFLGATATKGGLNTKRVIAIDFALETPGDWINV